MERCEEVEGKGLDWWLENMPPGCKYTPTVRYRKVGVKSFDIFNIIEILDNKKECCIEFQNGKTIIVQGSFAKVYEAWIKAEDFDDEDDDHLIL